MDGIIFANIGVPHFAGFCRIPGKLFTSRIVRERLWFLKHVQANSKCLEMFHKAPAHSSMVEPVFGSDCWSGCICNGVLGFVEFCVPTLHLWERGSQTSACGQLPFPFQLSFRGQSIADRFVCGLGSWVTLGSISPWNFKVGSLLQDLLPSLLDGCVLWPPNLWPSLTFHSPSLLAMHVCFAFANSVLFRYKFYAGFHFVEFDDFLLF